MYLILIFLPLLSSITAGLFGRKLGPLNSGRLTVTCLIITFFLSAFSFYEVGLSGTVVYIPLAVWIDSELFNVEWGFLFDTLTVVMCCVVTFVSSLVHLYSTEYMSHDPHLPRFMSYLSLFTFFMLMLITADNYVQMFLGWEGVGLCSYLLINFWFTRIQANKAAIKAMIVNRIGDFGLALGIFTIFVKYGAVDYATVFALTPFFVNETFNFLNMEIDLLFLISILLFVGEGVGLCSYLLINFWFTRIQANKAAIKAMIVNRIGDFGLALGIFTIFVKYGAVDYATVFALTPFFVNETFNFLNMEIDLLFLISILLFVGAVGKSAQIGLHTWLPDAMEGPTPVSALIHAATMVTAGVFLISRSSPLFEYSPSALTIVTILGACTAFFAATTGLLQNDLKRVIAYSTCSQLGYMVLACGLSNYTVGVFHLANHAFFKALLFLGAGSVIHAVSDEQDMRKMGGLRKLVPFTYSVILIGSLALMGFPFLTGFYSKDVILEVAYGKFTTTGHFAYVLGSLAAFFTAFYSLRLVCLTFLSEPNGYKEVISYAHDSPIRMSLPLAILAIPSIFVGYLSKDMIIGLGSDFWGNAIYTLPKQMNMIDAEFIEHRFKVLPVVLSVTGATLSFFLYNFKTNALFQLKISRVGRKLYTFLNRKWFFDKIYNEYIIQPSIIASYNITYKTIDRGIIEILGPSGISKFVFDKATLFQRLQTGFIYHYAFLMLVFVSCIIIQIYLINFSSILTLMPVLLLFDFRILIVLVISFFFV